MVDRIDKSNRNEQYWKVQATTNTHEEKDEQESSKDEFSSFQEKTDWNLLFNKSNLWKRNIQLSKDEIAQILFRKINLKTDPSLLRVDLLLKDGQKMSPAFIALSRIIGLKIKNLNSGDPIPMEFLLQNDRITVTIPTKPELFETKTIPSNSLPQKNGVKDSHSEQDATEINFKPKSWISFLGIKDPTTHRYRLEFIVIYGVVILFLFLLLWGYLLIR